MSPKATTALIVTGAVTAFITLAIIAVSLVDSTPKEAPRATRQTITVTVDTHPSDSGLRALFEDAKRTHTAPGGYYFEVNCRTGGTSTVGNRLATGRFAVGQGGANLTGLAPGGYELTIHPGRSCPS